MMVARALALWIGGLVLWMVLFALHAKAASWAACPAVLDNTGTAPGAPSQVDKEICIRQSNASNTPRVNARACRGGVDAVFNADVAGSTFTATAYPYVCQGAGAVGDVTDCEKIMVDRTGDGVVDDVPMNGDPAAAKLGTYNLPPTWLTFLITNGSSNTIELKVICK